LILSVYHRIGFNSVDIGKFFSPAQIATSNPPSAITHRLGKTIKKCAAAKRLIIRTGAKRLNMPCRWFGGAISLRQPYVTFGSTYAAMSKPHRCMAIMQISPRNLWQTADFCQRLGDKMQTMLSSVLGKARSLQ
jgi:hypothetical protein